MTSYPWCATLGVLGALGLTGCEFVLGGPDQAVIRSRDGALEDADPLEAGVDTALVPDSAMADAGGTGMMSTPCLDAQQACVLDCTMQLNECMVGPPGKDNGCQSDFDDCKATCQSTCVTCVACPAGASACLFP